MFWFVVCRYSGVFLHTVDPEVHKVCFRLQVCFGKVVLVGTDWCFCWTCGWASLEDALGITWVHLVSLGFWVHLVSTGSLGVTWYHLVSLGLIVTLLSVTRFHLVSLGFTFASLGVTWCHFWVPRFHLVSLGVVSLGFTRCHLISRKPGSCGFLGFSCMTWVH